jgi:CoA-disulfide reductase
MERKIVIVGGVAGGATAAARLRRLNETDRIVMVERGEHISFANCGLPYYIGGAIRERGKLFVQTAERMSRRFALDIRTQSEVTRINRAAKTVTIRNLQTGETYEEDYDILVLAPGAKPIVPDWPGIQEAEALFTLRNIPDTDRIKAYVDNACPQHAVVIGGGFIGVEMAENLRERDVAVTLVELGNQVLAPLDFEMAAIVQEHMRANGVELVLGDAVQALADKGRRILLQSGRELTADMIVLAIGVQPESELAKEAGLELGVRGAIKVSPTLQTSDPSIYAIGDAIEVHDLVNGQPTVVPLAWGANRQGRLVADRINGMDVSYRGALGTAIVKVFSLTAAVVGNNEKTLKKWGIPYETVHIHPNSHAGYYPGAAQLSLKLLFDRSTGRILGAQAVGADGVDKRIDVIATAMKAGLTVRDLPDLELCYAPPYSSAKDPVNLAGYVASNIVDGLAETVQWHEIDQIVADGGLLIDVREPIEREAGFVPGSINIPLDQLRDRLADIPRDRPVYVSCQVGLRGYLAARILAQHGYRVKNLDGGYKTYSYAAREKSRPPRDPDGTGAAGDRQADTRPADRPAGGHSAEAHPSAHVTIDACGLQCPGPIMQVFQAIQQMNPGEVLAVSATDPGFGKDIAAWCEKTGHVLLHSELDKNVCTAYIRKDGAAKEAAALQAASAKEANPGVSGASPAAVSAGPSKNGATLIVFSGDLDKAIASFIIASGAAAMGKRVTMFFTFWGLNILRKQGASASGKQPLEKMLGAMMPKGPHDLPLSKMNMGGLGAKMIRYVMEQKNVDSLETLMRNAQAAGVKLVACTMSMEIMGIKLEELIDGVEFAGVASYLGDAEDAGINLFV